MRALAAKTILLLFLALVVQCAFDGPGVKAGSPSLPHEDSPFCGVLNATSVNTTLPAQLAYRPSSGESIGPVPEVYPSWSLAQSIDHPPEQPA